MKKNHHGFTLAELLIVVAIIAVLVAVAIPVLNTNLERAREAVDLSEIRNALERVSSLCLSMGSDAPESVDDEYKEAYKVSDGVYETWVKITQETENWQTYNNEEKAIFAGAEAPADVLKDHWVIQFHESDQNYSIEVQD